MSTTTSHTDSTVHTTERAVHVVGGCPVGHDFARRLASQRLSDHLHDTDPAPDLPDSREVHDPSSLTGDALTGTGIDTIDATAILGQAIADYC